MRYAYPVPSACNISKTTGSENQRRCAATRDAKICGRGSPAWLRDQRTSLPSRPAAGAFLTGAKAAISIPVSAIAEAEAASIPVGALPPRSGERSASDPPGNRLRRVVL
jgi:hypothetical protein